jgi:myo-inositol-1(or 4)-monophosphatase
MTRPPSKGGDRPVARVGRAPVGPIRERSAPLPRASQAPRSPLMTVMQRAAFAAGKGLKRDFGEVEHLQFSEKGPGDFVSHADLRAEQVLREHLLHGRPSFGFLGEEGGETKGAGEYRWIVDPLDGTTNFMHGVPHFAISIALERDGEVVAGLVYNPANDDLFYAEKGYGAFLETPFARSRRLRVSGRRQLGGALMATGIPYQEKGDHARFTESLRAVMAKTSGVRRFGAAALDLCWVAAARFDGFWEFDLSPWDVAAGTLIVREAGGVISDIAGKPYALGGPTILAINPPLRDPVVELLAPSA